MSSVSAFNSEFTSRAALAQNKAVKNHTNITVSPKSEEAYYLKFNALQDYFSVDENVQGENWQRWWKGLISLKIHRVPAPVPVQQRELLLSQLHKTDPRGIFAGLFVDCCLQPQGRGNPCAWHGHESPDGAFWVVERYGGIIAVAWVWRHGDSLVIDSVDIARTDKGKNVVSRDKRIQPLYYEAAKSLIGKAGIARVYAGLGLQGKWTEKAAVKRPFPTPALYGEVEDIDDSKWVYLLAGA